MKKNQKNKRKKKNTSSVSKLLCLIQNVSFFNPRSSSENLTDNDFSLAVCGLSLTDFVALWHSIQFSAKGFGIWPSFILDDATLNALCFSSIFWTLISRFLSKYSFALGSICRKSSVLSSYPCARLCMISNCLRESTVRFISPCFFLSSSGFWGIA